MTRLRQILTYFEDPTQIVSIHTIAQDMGISTGQVESMLDFWIRKGDLQLKSINESNCGSCGGNQDCPFTKGHANCYELV